MPPLGFSRGAPRGRPLGSGRGGRPARRQVVESEDEEQSAESDAGSDADAAATATATAAAPPARKAASRTVTATPVPVPAPAASTGGTGGASITVAPPAVPSITTATTSASPATAGPRFRPRNVRRDAAARSALVEEEARKADAHAAAERRHQRDEAKAAAVARGKEQSLAVAGGGGGFGGGRGGGGRGRGWWGDRGGREGAEGPLGVGGGRGGVGAGVPGRGRAMGVGRGRGDAQAVESTAAQANSPAISNAGASSSSAFRPAARATMAITTTSSGRQRRDDNRVNADELHRGESGASGNDGGRNNNNSHYDDEEPGTPATSGSSRTSTPLLWPVGIFSMEHREPEVVVATTRELEQRQLARQAREGLVAAVGTTSKAKGASADDAELIVDSSRSASVSEASVLGATSGGAAASASQTKNDSLKAKAARVLLKGAPPPGEGEDGSVWYAAPKTRHQKATVTAASPQRRRSVRIKQEPGTEEEVAPPEDEMEVDGREEGGVDGGQHGRAPDIDKIQFRRHPDVSVNDFAEETAAREREREEARRALEALYADEQLQRQLERDERGDHELFVGQAGEDGEKEEGEDANNDGPGLFSRRRLGKLRASDDPEDVEAEADQEMLISELLLPAPGSEDDAGAAALDKDGRLYLFQFPPVLPQLVPTLPVVVEPSPPSSPALPKAKDEKTSSPDRARVKSALKGGKSAQAATAKGKGKATAAAAALAEHAAVDAHGDVLMLDVPPAYLQPQPNQGQPSGHPPSGYVGRLVVRRSGRVQLEWGAPPPGTALAGGVPKPVVLEVGPSLLAEYSTTALLLEEFDDDGEEGREDEDEEDEEDKEEEERRKDALSKPKKRRPHDPRSVAGTATGMGTIMGKFAVAPGWGEGGKTEEETTEGRGRTKDGEEDEDEDEDEDGDEADGDAKGKGKAKAKGKAKPKAKPKGKGKEVDGADGHTLKTQSEEALWPDSD